MAEPLEILAEALSDGRAPPFDWVVEYAADGTIRTLWESCKDARTLLKVYAYSGDRLGFVRAACACARTTLKYVPASDDRPRVAIETAEAWTRGEVDVDRVRKAAVGSAATASGSAGDAAMYAASAAADAAYAVFSEAYVTAYGAASFYGASAGVRRRTLAELAKIVRALVPCPTLEQLAALVQRRLRK